jgi:class 3 adenylate cyclase
MATFDSRRASRIPLLRSWLEAVLTLGSDPRDSEDERVRKVLLLTAVVILLPLTAAWGAIYWMVGIPVAASIPWAYTALSVIGIAIFAMTRSYWLFALSQFGFYTTLPFVLMWVLGGFVGGSAVALWAMLAPLVAVILGHRQLSAALLTLYVALVAISASLPVAPMRESLPAALVTLFFVLNLSAVTIVSFLLLRTFAGGRESSLRAARGVLRRYLSPDVAAAILTDPQRQELGGEITEVSVLFADLGGYTTFAERRRPDEVVTLLNRYFAVVVPCILEEGGTPVQMPGDAVMAIFGAPRPQPDHAVRACRAALRIAAVEPVAEDGPRFHIGVNSGPALVGNIGSEEFRNFTAIGDTTNLAARLQQLAEPGQIAIGPATADAVGGELSLRPLGAVRVKGKQAPVEVFELVAPA